MDASELTYAIVLLNNIDCFDDLCILSIAYNSECKSFLADPIVQTTIDYIWFKMVWPKIMTPRLRLT